MGHLSSRRVRLPACILWWGLWWGLGIALTGGTARADANDGRYQTNVRAEKSRPLERFELSGTPLSTVPGTLGDPFRVIAALPGVSTPMPGLPLFVVRGGSPGTNGFFLDGMRLPQLFHLLIGGAVVHSEVIDQVQFYPGGYDVRFGHVAGGVLAGTTRPARDDGQHFSATLRLYDASAVLELSLPHGVRITASGHYGYPGPILRAIDERINLSYWDYQLRLDWGPLTVQALGAHDTLDLNSQGTSDWGISQSSRLEFHRLQVRYRKNRGPLSVEAAVVGGIDQAGDASGRGVEKLSLGYRLQLQSRWSWFKLFLGSDGELSRFDARDFDLGIRSLAFVRDAEGPLRLNPGGPDSRLDELGEVGESRPGGTLGVYAQAGVTLFRKRLELVVGTRIDVYRAAGITLIGVDPRAQLDLHLLPWLDMHVAGGVYQQPPSFPVLLPGIDTFALELGLQRAVGGSISEELKLPAGLNAQLTGFYQKLDNLTDLPPLGARVCAQPPDPLLRGTTATLIRRTDGRAYGLEVLLRRQTGRITGWLAYTLSRSERDFPCGTRPADYDQTHVLNLVVQARLPRGFSLGGRLNVQSGRPETVVATANENSDVLGDRNNMRLPPFVELDLRLDKEWRFRRWALSMFVEVVNSTFSKTVLYYTFPKARSVGNTVTFGPPEEVSFRWILPSIGLRGGF